MSFPNLLLNACENTQNHAETPLSYPENDQGSIQIHTHAFFFGVSDPLSYNSLIFERFQIQTQQIWINAIGLKPIYNL